jgi:predicted RNase H-like HicB family nuclease
MIQSPIAAGTPVDEVLRVLGTRGFRSTVHGRHVLVERDDIRLSLPGPGRVLPSDFVVRLEYALEAILGEGWLTSDTGLAPDHTLGELIVVGEKRLVVVDAVITQSSEHSPWCAFLPDELTIMGFGATRDEALRDLKSATALWLGVDVHDVVLVTPTLV